MGRGLPWLGVTMEGAGVGAKQNYSRVRVAKGNLEERGSWEDSACHC